MSNYTGRTQQATPLFLKIFKFSWPWSVELEAGGWGARVPCARGVASSVGVHRTHTRDTSSRDVVCVFQVDSDLNILKSRLS